MLDQKYFSLKYLLLEATLLEASRGTMEGGGGDSTNLHLSFKKKKYFYWRVVVVQVLFIV